MTELRTIGNKNVTKYYCKIDNKLLAEVYSNGSGIAHFSCRHFEVRQIDAEQYKDDTEKYALKFFNGKFIYLYIPKSG